MSTPPVAAGRHHHDQPTQPTVADVQELECRFDPDTVRAWLTSTQPGGDATIAEQLRIVDDFDIYGFERWARISDLVEAAQAAGVFGLDTDHIDVLHLAGERGFVNAHRITLTRPGHATVCSHDLDTVELLTDHLYGVDAAVHLLARTAEAANTLVQQRAQLAHPDPPNLTHDAERPAPTQAVQRSAAPRAFRPLAVDTQAPSAAITAKTSANGAKRRR